MYHSTLGSRGNKEEEEKKKQVRPVRAVRAARVPEVRWRERSVLGWGLGIRAGSLAVAFSGLRVEYRGTSLTRKRTPLGPYRRPMPRVLGGS